jgi:hypothetical protein
MRGDEAGRCALLDATSKLLAKIGFGLQPTGGGRFPGGGRVSGRKTCQVVAISRRGFACRRLPTKMQNCGRSSAR